MILRNLCKKVTIDVMFIASKSARTVRKRGYVPAPVQLFIYYTCSLSPSVSETLPFDGYVIFLVGAIDEVNGEANKVQNHCSLTGEWGGIP